MGSSEMIGVCKVCEYGHLINGYCEKRKAAYPKDNVCPDFLEAGFLCDLDYGDNDGSL